MKKWIWIAGFIGLALNTPVRALSADFTVYQVYRPVDLGIQDTPPPKDIYISMGAENGIKKGSKLDCYRKVASFSHLTQQHVGDHLMPVGRLKVIHVDQRTAVARLEQFVSIEQEPALYPQAVMIGDLVQLAK